LAILNNLVEITVYNGSSMNSLQTNKNPQAHGVASGHLITAFCMFPAPSVKKEPSVVLVFVFVGSFNNHSTVSSSKMQKAPKSAPKWGSPKK